MERRRFLQIALGGVTFAAVAGVAACRSSSCPIVEGADPAWAALSDKERARALAEATFGERIEDARLIGETYASVPGTGDRVERFRCTHVEGQPDLQAALSSIETAITRDFAARRIVNLQGWVLSETELARCVLALT